MTNIELETLSLAKSFFREQIKKSYTETTIVAFTKEENETLKEFAERCTKEIAAYEPISVQPINMGNNNDGFMLLITKQA